MRHCRCVHCLRDTNSILTMNEIKIMCQVVNFLAETGTSVTRWLDYLFNIWPFTYNNENLHKSKTFANKDLKFCQILKRLYWPKW